MRPLFLLLIAIAAAPAAGQTYKWTDERGVVTYGGKPPPGRPAQLVDAQPRGPADLPEAQQKELESQARQRARMQAYAPPPPPPPPRPAAPQVRGMTTDTFIRLERGMSEAELLARAGFPDQVTASTYHAAYAKEYYYLPTTHDPFITTVTVSGGRIAHLERTRKF